LRHLGIDQHGPLQEAEAEDGGAPDAIATGGVSIFIEPCHRQIHQLPDRGHLQPIDCVWCHLLRGLWITWSASIAKQYRNLGSCKADPIAFAKLVLEDYRAMKLTFITWNGAGDLFEESVQAINQISEMAPNVPQWVRTRKPALAGKIRRSFRTWVHFSLDRDSLDRAKQIDWRTDRHFYSYQYAPGETGPYPDFVSVVFGHDYKMPEGVDGPEVCPLNTNEDIKDICEGCRRCFGRTDL